MAVWLTTKEIFPEIRVGSTNKQWCDYTAIRKNTSDFQWKALSIINIHARTSAPHPHAVRVERMNEFQRRCAGIEKYMWLYFYLTIVYAREYLENPPESVFWQSYLCSRYGAVEGSRRRICTATTWLGEGIVTAGGGAGSGKMKKIKKKKWKKCHSVVGVYVEWVHAFACRG